MSENELLPDDRNEWLLNRLISTTYIHENSIISCVLYVQKREIRQEKTSKEGYGGGVYNDNRYITTSLDPFQGNGLPFPMNTGLPFLWFKDAMEFIHATIDLILHHSTTV